jgi:hypothetical protein
MDGHPRQNPAYRSAKETPANAGVSIWACITCASRESGIGSVKSPSLRGPRGANRLGERSSSQPLERERWLRKASAY